MKIMTEHIPEQVIPAHDCVTELYTFDELPSGTQDSLVRRCAECHADDWDSDYRATLAALEKLFGVKCDDWEVSIWRGHNYRLRVNSSGWSHDTLNDAAEDAEEFGYLALRGNRAMGKCWTAWGDEVTEGKYYSGPMHGTPGKDCHYAHRHSKVLFVGLHDGSCPLTGYCADNDALDPLWDMMEGKHINDGTTIAEMIDACFDSFFTAWQKDMEYTQSEEYFREYEMAEWYDADGNEVEVPSGATLTDPKDKEVAA